MSQNPRRESSLPALGTEEELPVSHELCAVHAAGIAVALDGPRALLEHARARPLPRDLDEVGPHADDVVLRDHAEELPVLDYRQAADAALAHPARGLLDLLVRVDGDDGRRHDVADLERGGLPGLRSDLPPDGRAPRGCGGARAPP